jgi:CheY-like chemotaxis protein/DNA-binding CsgD family transcriptional regulator
MTPMSPPPATASAEAPILIVDDDPGNLSLLVDALGGAGYRPFIATSGEAALESLAHSVPAIILLDMRMPGMDGLQTCGRLQADARWREIPVIFMTAVEEPDQKVAAFAAGAVDYVTKPFHAEEVLARIGAHLRIKALQAQLEAELARRAELELKLEASLEQAVIVLADDGHIQFCTQRAAHLLAQFFPGHEPGLLPPPLARHLTATADGPAQFDGGYGVLEAHFARGTETGAPTLITFTERRREGDYAPLRHLGLSEREAEVLYWMSQGKTAPEIAVIIGAAAATVRKHSERVYAKLGVEGHRDAMLRALEVLQARP